MTTLTLILILQTLTSLNLTRGRSPGGNYRGRFPEEITGGKLQGEFTGGITGGQLHLLQKNHTMNNHTKNDYTINNHTMNNQTINYERLYHEQPTTPQQNHEQP